MRVRLLVTAAFPLLLARSSVRRSEDTRRCRYRLRHLSLLLIRQRVDHASVVGAGRVVRACRLARVHATRRGLHGARPAPSAFLGNPKDIGKIARAKLCGSRAARGTALNC